MENIFYKKIIDELSEKLNNLVKDNNKEKINEIYEYYLTDINFTFSWREIIHYFISHGMSISKLKKYDSWFLKLIPYTYFDEKKRNNLSTFNKINKKGETFGNYLSRIQSPQQGGEFKKLKIKLKHKLRKSNKKRIKEQNA